MPSYRQNRNLFQLLNNIDLILVILCISTYFPAPPLSSVLYQTHQTITPPGHYLTRPLPNQTMQAFHFPLLYVYRICLSDLDYRPLAFIKSLDPLLSFARSILGNLHDWMIINIFDSTNFKLLKNKMYDIRFGNFHYLLN